STPLPDIPHGKRYVEHGSNVRLKKTGMLALARLLESIEKSGYPMAITKLNIRHRSGHREREAMKERLLRYAKYAPLVGYPLFYLLCLAVFAALTFPYDKLRQRVVATFNADQRATNGQQELQIDEMSGYWLTGVRVRGVRILTASAMEPNKPPAKLEIDEATVR